MRICQKCGYKRTPQDDEFVFEGECPKCGVVYAKFNVAKHTRPDSPKATANKTNVAGLAKVLMLVGLVLVGAYVWHNRSGTPGSIVPASKSGFVAICLLLARRPIKFWLWAPHETVRMGVRTRQLAEQVAQRGMPHKSTSSISFQPTGEAELMQAWQSVSAGLPPIVVINGKARSNPTIEQIVDEYSQPDESAER